MAYMRISQKENLINQMFVLPASAAMMDACSTILATFACCLGPHDGFGVVPKEILCRLSLLQAPPKLLLKHHHIFEDSPSSLLCNWRRPKAPLKKLLGPI